MTIEKRQAYPYPRDLKSLGDIEKYLKELHKSLAAGQSGLTEVMTTEFSTAASESWPIGSVFFSVLSTNPSTLLGLGTWTQIGSGKFIVGQDASDAVFDTAEETGGAKTKNLAHVHSVDPPSTTTSDTNWNILGGTTASVHVPDRYHTHTVDIAAFDSASGGSATQDILPPYLVLYIWKRVA